MQKECNPLYRENRSSYFPGKRKVERRPWVDVITADAVVVSLLSLKVTRKLPEAVHKKLQARIVGEPSQTECSFCCYKSSRLMIDFEGTKYIASLYASAWGTCKAEIQIRARCFVIDESV